MINLNSKISRVFAGRRSALPADMTVPPLSVSVFPGDAIADIRERLIDDVIRVLRPEEWRAQRCEQWYGLLRPWVEAAIPGPPAAPADPAAPPAPLGAEPWPLAPDSDVYGDHAGWWIVVDATGEHELSEAYPTRELAEREAQRLNGADPNAEWYRHWFAFQGGVS